MRLFVSPDNREERRDWRRGRLMGEFVGDLRYAGRTCFAIELLDDLGPALLPPHGRARDLPAVLERQDFRKVWVRICQRLVVVGVVGRRFVAARPWTQRFDAELLHHVSVIGGGRGGGRIRRRTACLGGCLYRS